MTLSNYNTFQLGHFLIKTLLILHNSGFGYFPILILSCLSHLPSKNICDQKIRYDKCVNILSGWLRLQETGAWDNIIAKYSRGLKSMEDMRKKNGQNNRQQKLQPTHVGIAFVGYIVALATALGILALEFVLKHCLRID